MEEMTKLMAAEITDTAVLVDVRIAPKVKCEEKISDLEER